MIISVHKHLFTLVFKIICQTTFNKWEYKCHDLQKILFYFCISDKPKNLIKALCDQESVVIYLVFIIKVIEY